MSKNNRAKTRIIGEIGVNHNGNLKTAMETVDAFANTDIEFLKFQTFDAKLLVTPDAPKAEYQTARTDSRDSAFQMLEKLTLSRKEFIKLKDHVHDSGKKFLSTAFDEPSVDFLASLGAKEFKIPSGEITNLSYLRKVASSAQTVFLSTGMSNLEEVNRAVSVLEDCGVSKTNITVLQCNTGYPSPLEDANILAMVEMGNRLGTSIGYSDHTLGPVAAMTAVALGASVIEKHITLSKKLEGPDHAASMEPDEFSEYIANIRAVEKALGSSVKKATNSEIANRPIARRGLYAAHDIEVGSRLSQESVIALRPEALMSAMDFEEVIGKTALKKIMAFSPIAPDDFL